MKIMPGYLYHIKDEFFDKIGDETLMSNHERGKKRPTYYTIKIEDVLWFIPLSSKVEKYKKIIEHKIKKYGHCNSILIGEINGEESVILLQNAFPTLEKYIDHIHTEDGIPVRVPENLKKEIQHKFQKLMKSNKRGQKIFFSDVDAIEELMKKELEEEKKTIKI